MELELDNALCKEFPSIFRDRNGKITETCMAWGCEVGLGWFDLLRDICLFINNAIENAKSEKIYEYKRKHNIDYSTELSAEILKKLKIDEMIVVADQVKEKYGELCFYHHSMNLPERWIGEIDGAIRMAQMQSSKICEECGERGEMRGLGWFFTACDKHSRGIKTIKEYKAWEDAKEKNGPVA